MGWGFRLESETATPTSSCVSFRSSIKLTKQGQTPTPLFSQAVNQATWWKCCSKWKKNSNVYWSGMTKNILYTSPPSKKRLSFLSPLTKRSNKSIKLGRLEAQKVSSSRCLAQVSPTFQWALEKEPANCRAVDVPGFQPQVMESDCKRGFKTETRECENMS